MTPREKAVDIYEQMYYAIHVDGNQDYWNSADRASLIAVNEIIKTISDSDELEYWEKVKEEIKNL